MLACLLLLEIFISPCMLYSIVITSLYYLFLFCISHASLFLLIFYLSLRLYLLNFSSIWLIKCLIYSISTVLTFFAKVLQLLLHMLSIFSTSPLLLDFLFLFLDYSFLLFPQFIIRCPIEIRSAHFLRTLSQLIIDV